jgi:hypothetical protein
MQQTSTSLDMSNDDACRPMDAPLQVMLRLLTTVISAFDPLSAAAVQPLQQVS